jgi:hypothetical protein
MIKLLSNKLVISFLGLLIVLCSSCGTKETEKGKAIDTGVKPATVETKPEIEQAKPVVVETPPEAAPKETPVVEAPADPNVVAKISDYVIFKDELEEEVMNELLPKYDEFEYESEPVDAKTVLMRMIAEKAMIMDAREQNYLEHETVRTSIEYFKQTGLVSMLIQKFQRDLKGKIEVTEAEIDEKVNADPKLERSYVRSIIEMEKSNDRLREYYLAVYEKLHVQKASDNFPKVAEIHQRLLLQPKEEQRYRFIRAEQVKKEVTQEEKDMVLATYDGGKVTLQDWFDMLFEMSPPRRPTDLGTPEGVERLLDRTLGRSLFVVEARLMGLDKDENFLKQVKEEEDKRLFNEISYEKVKNILPPTDEEQVVTYFNEHKEVFGTQKKLRIDEIWCQDHNIAQKAKEALDSGMDFNSVRQEYALEKEGNPSDEYSNSEGVFFKDIWKGEPNEIVGPIKGFYRGGVMWRIVKILEKKPGELVEYSSDAYMGFRVKRRIQRELRQEALQKYRKELLEKYPYEIYEDRIKDIDPLNIP